MTAEQELLRGMGPVEAAAYTKERDRVFSQTGHSRIFIWASIVNGKRAGPGWSKEIRLERLKLKTTRIFRSLIGKSHP